VCNAFASAISNVPAFASPTTDTVFRFATAIHSTTARNARFADNRIAAIPDAANAACAAISDRVAGITAPGGSFLCGRHVYRFVLIVASATAFAVAIIVASASIAAFISISAFISIPAYASACCQHHPACTADVHPFSFSLF
jgi:hypothetical protein